MLKAIRAFVILPCAALLAGTFVMQAAAVKSETFRIPFDFRVQKQSLPAGEYSIQQSQGSEIVILTNTKTGKHVELLRPVTRHEPGKAHLEFKDDANGKALTAIY